ncbi:MAG: hypothetical protein WCQ90_08955 [Deltaproteobacteria bacterium]
MSDEHNLFGETTEALFRRFNEPVVTIESIKKWLSSFDDEDKFAALLLLSHIEYHSQPRVMRETRLVHEQLLERLSMGRFDVKTFQDIDFSREFTCKSGDVVSFIYRKSNLIPNKNFKTFDQLIRETVNNPDMFKNRALVILDDYIGTGSQFIFHFIGENSEDARVINSYRKTYLVSYIIHEKALQNFRLLFDGKVEQFIMAEKEQFPDFDFTPEEETIRRNLTNLDWNKIELVYLEIEKPLMSLDNKTLNDNEKRQIDRLLNKYKQEGYSGTSYLLGHHTFFFGAPNSLPRILWPLFNRVEDFSYTATPRPVDLNEDVIGYAIDNIDNEAGTQ